MTGREIARLIESPELCSQEDFAEIEKLADKYPYAQTFPLLMLQHLGKTDALDFEDQLSKHAFKISDRKHLYFLINEGKELSSAPNSEAPIEEPGLSIVPKEIAPLVEVSIVAEPIEIIEKGIEIEVDKVSHAPLENSEKSAEEQVAESLEEEVFVRADVEINPNEDMNDFRVVEVEEMTFEPVTIDFDEKDLEALDLDEPVVVEEKVDDDKYEDVEDKIDLDAEKVKETAEVETEVVVDKDFEVKENINQEVEVDHDEKVDVETKKVPEISQEVGEFEIRTEEVIETHETEEFSKHDHHVENTPKEENTEEVEETAENEIKPLAAFDPTADLSVPEIETEETEISPSTFDEKSEAISLDVISEEKEIEVENESTIIEEKIETEPVTTTQPEIIEEVTEVVKEAEEVTEEFENQLAEEKRSFLDWLKVSATTHSEEYQVKQQRTEEIVEKFIKDQPKITRISKTEEPEKKAAEFFKVSTIARESLNEDAMPVSETLAQIYINQGNFGKAIDAYNQLLLFYPEKKSFFADQIKKLKKKIKS